MSTLTNFMLGTLLAAALIAPEAWAEAGQGVRAAASVAATEVAPAAQLHRTSTTGRLAPIRTP